MARLLNYIKVFFLQLKFVVWKIMNAPISFDNFDDQLSVVIDIEHINTILLGYYEPDEFDADGLPIKYREIIIVIYTNGAKQSFPATSNNVANANKILALLKSKYSRP